MKIADLEYPFFREGSVAMSTWRKVFKTEGTTRKMTSGRSMQGTWGKSVEASMGYKGQDCNQGAGLQGRPL